MNLTLVAIHPYRSAQAVPLACAFLKETLLADEELQKAVQVDLADFFLDDDPADCASAILAMSPDLVGFSVYVWSRDHAIAIANDLKRLKPTLPLFAGGAEATANPEGVLGAGAFGFAVRGEGEGPIRQVVRLALNGEPPTGVPGVLFPGDRPGPLPASVDLDSIPSPYLSGLLDPRTVGGALWQLSRGCDFACSFCFDHKGSGGVRRFSMARVEQELRLFARLAVPQVFVLDSTFNKVPERAKEILRLIRKLAPQVHFHFEVRSEFIDPEMAELFASITCSLQIGLQSADPGILRRVGRGFDADDFRYRVSLLNSTGAIFGFDLIFGLPGDTLPTFRESLDFALSLYPNHLDIFPLAVLPGTRLYGKGEELGLAHLPAPPYTVLSTPEFPAGDLEQARRLASACDIFYSRGKAVAWFNAVTEALKLAPSAFLGSFAGFLAKRGIGDEQEIDEPEIWGMQRDFLAEIFTERKKSRLLPLALDLADYHHYYACALMATPPAPPGRKELKKMQFLRQPLALARSASLASFNYEILDILEAGEIELAQFASCFKPAKSWAVIYPADGEVCTESLAQPYFQLLQSLDGKQDAAPLCNKLGIPAVEAADFLEFAVAEGIVTAS
jgi:hypothetical protein